MMTRRSPSLLLIVLMASLVPAAARGEQDPLARAKDYYAAAAYEDALLVLNQLHSKAPATDVSAYQVFCLLALGRSDEATTAIQALVRVDPLYHASEAEASPRVRTFFEKVRRPMLPEIVKQSYARAKEAFYRKDMRAAAVQFDRVILLLDEMDAAENEELADLRTLAGGFRELSNAPPLPPPPLTVVSEGPTAALASVTLSPTPELRIYGPDDANVTRPVPIARVVPRWRPINATEQRLELTGTLELLISEGGTVISASLSKRVHPRYDPVLLQAARDWTFKPAMRNGVPVKYRYAFDIRLGAASQ